MGNELAKARQTIESLSRQLSDVQTDRDRWKVNCSSALEQCHHIREQYESLAAYVERLRTAGNDRVAPEQTLEDILAVLDERPSICLVHRDATVKVEALRVVYNAVKDISGNHAGNLRIGMGMAMDVIGEYREDYRQQAEGTI